MESPETSRHKLSDGDSLLLRENSTPKNHHRITNEDFSLYDLHKDSSPSLRTGQDVLEVGWGDSPEPLNLEKKSSLTKTPICKKKLEPKDSPRSSIPFKRRNIRSTLRLPSNSLVDIEKYVAEVQELSKNIMKEFDSNKLGIEINESKSQTNNNPIIKSNIATEPPPLLPKLVLEIQDTLDENKGNSSVQSKDLSFDNVLQTFINEEDEWLSQALSSQESAKTHSKISFVKCKSENELSITQPKRSEMKTSVNQIANNNNSNFRRTSSFDTTKNHCKLSGLSSNNGMSKVSSQSSITSSNETQLVSKVPTVQYSKQEIERKRLEAIYRREKKEIERRKMEALKRLEMKKMRTIKT